MSCNHCGKQIDVASSPEATSANVSSSQPTYTLENFHKRFAIAWREFVTQPFALVLLVWYFVSVLLNIIQVNTLLTDTGALLDSIGVALPSLTVSRPILILAQILICIPGVLVIIGMWLIYDDAHDHSDRPISSKGPTLIYVTTLITMILSGLGYVVSFFVFIASTKYLSTSMEAATILTYIFFGIILGAIPMFYLLRMYVQLVAGIRENVKTCTFSTTCVKAAAILEFIGGGFSLISLFASKITLCSLLTAALPILIGVMLLKYKRLIDALAWEHMEIESNTTTPRV